MTTYSDTVQQAFRDWNEHRAYVDNGGNYRVRAEAATPTHRPRGTIAPWNKEVKRLFESCAEFHAAAQELLKPGLLTEEEAQLVIGAIPLQALPTPDTDEEWYVHKNKREVVNRKGHYIAFTATESDAARIVSDHEAVRKLVDALRAARKYIDAGYQPPELMDQINTALVATGKDNNQ